MLLVHVKIMYNMRCVGSSYLLKSERQYHLVCKFCSLQIKSIN